MICLDHKQKALSRVYAEYRDKPKAFEWFGIVGDLANEIESAFCDIANSYNIDEAGTDELDVLGRIVVINRSYEALLSVDQFECNDTDVECGEPDVECTPKSLSQNQQVSNEIYRLLIKGKIAKNNNDATIDGIINALSFIVETDGISIVDNEDMSFDIIFDSLTDIEKLVILSFDIIPKPQGVRINQIIDLSAVSQFGRSQFGSSQFAFNI